MNHSQASDDGIAQYKAGLKFERQKQLEPTVNGVTYKKPDEYTPEQLAAAGAYVDEIIDRLGLRQISDTGELEGIIDTVLASNSKSVEEYKAGNAKAFNALVGQAMKATKGKGNPAQVNELLKSKLKVEQ